MKKLLLLGRSNDTKQVIEYCKKNGVYTVITDYNPPEQCPEKLQADEFWMIDVKDIDALENKCKEENITGVYAGNNEFCIDNVKELTKRLNFPFFASDKGWEASRNKIYFKECCQKVGLDVPKRYFLSKPFNMKELSEIQYPVVVKPIDSCLSRGVKKCENESELLIAYDEALEYSTSKTIVVEEFIEGYSAVFYFYLVNGNVYLLTNCCALKSRDEKTIPFFERASQIGVYNKDVNIDFLKKNKNKIEKLFEDLECKDGPIMLQTLEKNGKYYCYEMANRLDGGGSWYVTDYAFNFSALKYMVDYSIGNSVNDCLWHDWAVSDNYQCVTYMLMSVPGKVSKIDVSKIKNVKGIYNVLTRYKEGDEVVDVNNLFKMAYYFVVIGKNKNDLIEKLDFLNNNLVFEDEKGNNMLLFFKHYDMILESIQQ